MKQLILFTCMLIPWTLLAQETWDLQKCVNYALSNNISIKQSELTIKTAENALSVSKAVRLPSLNGYASHNLNSGNVYLPSAYSKSDYQSGNVGLSGEMPIYSGMSSKYSIERDKQLLDYSSQYSEQQKNDLVLQLVGLYMDLLVAHETIGIAKDQLVLTDEQTARTKQKVEAGLLPENELLRSAYQRSLEQLKVTEASNRFELSKLALYQLLEIKPGTSINFATEISQQPGAVQQQSADAVFQQAVKTLPGIKAQETYVQSLQTSEKIIKAGAFPKLSLAYRFDKEFNSDYDYSFAEQYGKSYFGSVGLKLSVPLMNGFSVKRNMAASGIKTAQAELELEKMKKDLYKQIQEALLHINHATETYSMRESSRNLAKENLKYAEKQLDAGVISLVEFNIEKTSYQSAETNLVLAKYDLLLKQKILDYYLGRPVGL